jgi:hypothetical protein
MITSGARGVHIFSVCDICSVLVSLSLTLCRFQLISWQRKHIFVALEIVDVPENQACASNSSHLLPVGQFYICPGVTLQDVTESPATRIFLFKLNHPFQFGFFNYDDVFADSQMWLLMSILERHRSDWVEWKQHRQRCSFSHLGMKDSFSFSRYHQVDEFLKLFLCFR